MQTTTEAPKRRALGKGLESLLPRVQAVAEPTPTNAVETGKPREIPVDEIERSPYPDAIPLRRGAARRAGGLDYGDRRRAAHRGAARWLAGRFQLIAGERRWLASQRAGKETIPAIVRHASDEQAMEMTIVENLQRTDLNPMEQARAYERLAREFQLTQEQMAKRTGKDRASVANFLRLLRLPVEVQSQVEAGALTFGHARALLPLEDPRRDPESRAKGDRAGHDRSPDRELRAGHPEPERKPAKGEQKEKPSIRTSVTCRTRSSGRSA